LPSSCDSQTIHSYHPLRIRTRRGHQRLLRYIGEKITSPRTSSPKLIGITMHAIRTLKITSRTFLVKFLHKWLPVGKQVHRYNPSICPSHCLSCQIPVDDLDHTFSYPDLQRRGWQSKLRTALIKLSDQSSTTPVLAIIILEGLHHWFHQTLQPPSSPYPPYDSLIRSQTEIGLSQFLLGRCSLQWIVLQHSYLCRTDTSQTPQNSSPRWLGSIIKLF
jgi:hypothetical protein